MEKPIKYKGYLIMANYTFDGELIGYILGKEKGNTVYIFDDVATRTVEQMKEVINQLINDTTMKVKINDYTVILRPDRAEFGDCIKAIVYVEKNDSRKTNVREFVDYGCQTQKQMLRKIRYYLEYRDNGGREQ